MAAGAYLDFFIDNPEYSEEKVEELVTLGDNILEEAGSMAAAAAGVAAAWWDRSGSHL